MLESVKHLAERGFALHWLRPRSKAPVADDWSNLPTATVDALKRSYRDAYNVGVRLGEPSSVEGLYLHLLDMDVRDPACVEEAKTALRKLIPDAYELPTVASGSGGASRHFYFLTDKPFGSKKLAISGNKFTGADDKKHWTWEIELFGTGKQAAMPPSIHPDTGQPYRWEREFDFDMVEMGLGPVIPSATVETWGVGQARRDEDPDDLGALVRQKPLGLTEDEILGHLKWLPLDYWCEDRDGWRELGMALSHETEGSERGYEIWCEFSRQSDKFDEKDSRRVWRSFKGAATPVRMPTIIKAAGLARLEQEHGEDEDDFAAEDDDEDLIGGVHSTDTPQDDIDAIGTAKRPDLEWKSLLEFNEEGAVKPSLANIALIVEHDPRTLGIVRLNQFTCEVVKRAVPGRKPGKTEKGIVQLDSELWKLADPINGDIWSESMDNAIRHMVEITKTRGGYGIKVTDRDLKAAVDLVAQRNPFHPIREYLGGLKWDGRPRVDRLFVDYLNAPDSPYTRQVARMFLVAAVTRVFEPGHKFDFAPILEGLQGKRKSTFIRTLAKHWSAELEGDFHDPKGLVELMQGAWLLEIPELSGFGKADVRVIKAFMSRTDDKVRLAYARRAQVFPRQCVFMGSTNDREYLRDDTGGRRFWPVECRVEGEIDTDRLAREVDQIWAEALVVYREMRAKQPKGTLPLYLTDKAAQSDALLLQEDRRIETAEDALVGQITAWLDRPLPEDFPDGDEDLIGGAPARYRDQTCLLEIWVECLGNDKKSYNNGGSQLLGRAMRRITGWASQSHPLSFEKYGRQRAYKRVGRD